MSPSPASAARRPPSGLPASMPAAVYRRPGVIDVEERPLPAVDAHDVLVAVHHCGVCGSDLHSVLEGWGIPDTIGGHEWSGEVVAVGDGVDRWHVGDLVVGGPSRTCGRCDYCRGGRPSLCAEKGTPGTEPFQGAFASYVVAHEAEVLAVPDGLSPRAASLVEPLAVALHGIGRSGVRTDQRVLVSGAGPIGALSLAVLVHRGHLDVVVVEPGERRADLARRLGAARVLHPSELDVPSVAEPGRIVEGAVDVVLETSGARAAMEAGLAQLRKAGTLVLVGAGIDPPHLDPNRILLNELVVTGSFVYDADGFERALELLGSGALPVDQLIDPVDVPLGGLLDAMQGLVRGEIAGKALVDPRLDQEVP